MLLINNKFSVSWNRFFQHNLFWYCLFTKTTFNIDFSCSFWHAKRGPLSFFVSQIMQTVIKVIFKHLLASERTILRGIQRLKYMLLWPAHEHRLNTIYSSYSIANGPTSSCVLLSSANEANCSTNRVERSIETPNLAFSGNSLFWHQVKTGTTNSVPNSL